MRNPVVAALIVVFGTCRMLAWMKQAIDAGNLVYMMAAFWGIVGWGFCMYLYCRFLGSDPDEAAPLLPAPMQLRHRPLPNGALNRVPYATDKD